MIMPRDQTALNLLDDFHCATTAQIHRLIFPKTSYRFAASRIKYLYDAEYIKRTNSTIDKGYAYYTDKKPIQLHHNLIRTELYSHMMGKYNIAGWKNEHTIEGVRPDAICFVEHSGIEFPIFIEIHITSKFDFEKYKDKDFKLLGPVIPRCIICTDRQVTAPSYKNVKFKVVGIDMAGLDSILK